LDGDCDDTDYLSPENGGSLRPGILLQFRGIIVEDTSTDGIMKNNPNEDYSEGIIFPTADQLMPLMSDENIKYGLVTASSIPCRNIRACFADVALLQYALTEVYVFGLRYVF
jgi:hypothetical protein